MTSRSSNPLLSAALAYAERGWSVFPLKPQDKAPITKNGFQDASTDRTQVLQWWQLFPDANVGLRCGDPFDVLDIDSPTEVPALQAILGTNYKHTGPVAITGKGKHLYFLADTKGRNRAGLLGGKLDYRGSGGYVVAPPSLHPSGRAYQWDKGRDYRAPLPDLPGELLTIVLRPKREPIPRKAIEYDTKTGLPSIVLTDNAAIAMTRPDIIATVQNLGCEVIIKGANHVTNCVFHHDPGPSMVLYTDDNSFYCFGCEAHGDSLNLLKGQDMTGRPLMND